jgi:hypothetical protein
MQPQLSMQITPFASTRTTSPTVWDGATRGLIRPMVLQAVERLRRYAPSVSAALS